MRLVLHAEALKRSQTHHISGFEQLQPGLPHVLAIIDVAHLYKVQQREHEVQVQVFTDRVCEVISFWPSSRICCTAVTTIIWSHCVAGSRTCGLGTGVLA